MSVQETFKRLPKQLLRVGNPISYPVYDRNGQLFSKSLLIESEAELEELYERGLYLDLETSKRIGLIRESKKEIVNDDATVEKTEEFIKLPFQSLKLGETLQINLTGESDNAQKYLVKLIGAIDKKSLICTIPTIQDKALFVKEGNGFVVQFFSGKSVYRFTTVVDAVLSRPYPHIHLMYPREAFVKKLRKNQRMAVNIVAALTDLANSQAVVASGRMVDLSLGGALIEMQKQALPEKSAIQCSFKIKLQGQEILFAIKGTVQTIAKETSVDEKEIFRYGVQFNTLPFQEKVYLQNYIYQLANEEKLED